MKRILLLDNYDSFTYNLAHYLIGLNVAVDVRRNDEKVINPLDYDGVVLSPGPGLPKEAGILMDVIQQCDGKIPVLGVCLGMQGIAEFLGGELYNLNEVKHGVPEKVKLENSELFKGMDSEIEVGLYHSWAVKPYSGEFNEIAFSENEVLMGLSNSERKLYGVQFHPESVMTPKGKEILANFLELLD